MHHTIRMVAMDLDDTALQKDGTFSKRTRAALQKAAEKGICLVAASGRELTAMPEEVLTFPGIRYAVVSNGAGIYTMGEKRTALRTLRLSAKAVEKVLAFSRTADHIFLEAGYQGQMYAPAAYVLHAELYQPVPALASYIRRTKKPVMDMSSWLLAHKDAIDCIDLICLRPADKTVLMRRIQTEIPDVYVTSSTDSLVEISHPQGGKAGGLRYLAEREDISPSEILAFGNGDNDVDMLRYAGIGVAVANGTPECLRAADVITDAHDADGVAIMLEQYGFM